MQTSSATKSHLRTVHASLFVAFCAYHIPHSCHLIADFQLTRSSSPSSIISSANALISDYLSAVPSPKVHTTVWRTALVVLTVRSTLRRVTPSHPRRHAAEWQILGSGSATARSAALGLVARFGIGMGRVPLIWETGTVRARNNRRDALMVQWRQGERA